MFYRVHETEIPFSAENAYSAPWGTNGGTCGACSGKGEVPHWEPRSCTDCGGWGGDNCGCNNGTVYDLIFIPCPYCDGTGTARILRGYSCFDTPEKLVAYFALRDPHNDAPVVIFAGDVVGKGPDGEMLVVPKQHPRPRWITWKQLAQTVSRRCV